LWTLPRAVQIAAVPLPVDCWYLPASRSIIAPNKGFMPAPLAGYYPALPPLRCGRASPYFPHNFPHCKMLILLQSVREGCKVARKGVGFGKPAGIYKRCGGRLLLNVVSSCIRKKPYLPICGQTKITKNRNFQMKRAP
jgi:hypothetical protein